MRGPFIAVAVDPDGRYAALVGGSDPQAHAEVLADGPLDQVAARMHRLQEDLTPRWVWWHADEVQPLLAVAPPVHRTFDLVEVHRLLVGGHDRDADLVWATAYGLDPDRRPAHRTGDLFDLAPEDEPTVRSDGYLSPSVLEQRRRTQPAHVIDWARLALTVATRQADLLASRPRASAAIARESGAALLCAELERDGLPLDRARLHDLLQRIAGPEPRTPEEAEAHRHARDQVVLRHAPGFERTDLRNPAQVMRLLHGVGVRVEDTRAHHLEPYRRTHPVVDALLQWRKAERIATTYGWAWLAEHVGEDDRLRGTWSACDGGAGRMTAGAGLHSLPATLREAVAAHPGHRLVRADLGQVEPRVLAVVSGDAQLARATEAADLYAQVASSLDVDRPTAKIAMLAAMYGQTTGPAAQALQGMERSYPVAMHYLRDAAAAGERGQTLTTYGGRLLPVETTDDPAVRRARGRYARNAVVQGAAAELFKAWALTARAALPAVDGHIVLCLHDELLVHVPEEHAPRAAQILQDTLESAAYHWSDQAPVRFVADISIIERWSQAKD